MGVAFREVLAAYGVDEDVKDVKVPALMVPLHGNNVVALDGAPDLKIVPVKDPKGALKIVKIDKGQLAQFIAGASKLSPIAREVKALSKDAAYFRITGSNLSGLSGVVLNAVDAKSGKDAGAQIKAVVLGQKVIKIAIREVQTSEGKQGWVNHGKKTFKPEVLRDQMNAVWLPQSNIQFDLVSTDPLQIKEEELADALKRNGYSRSDFLNFVHVEAFEPLFSKHSVNERNHFSIFHVKSVFTRPLNKKGPGSYPAGATPDKAHFCLVGDNMEHDPAREAKNIPTIPGIVPAHEAGHFMIGMPGHPDSTHDRLMVDGGPTVGFGKVTVELTVGSMNDKY
jgi:hypothetical protein